MHPRLLLLALLVGQPMAWAFTNLEVGDAVENVEMPTLDGRSQRLLGRARANLFVFFRPDQVHSVNTLRRLARMEREFAAKPVRFVAIVSDAYPAAAVRAAVEEAGIRMPVLVDRGNALYGKLGVRLQPVIGIADEQHRLAAYQHFTKINYEEVVRVRIRRLLEEATDAEVSRTLEPPRAEDSGPRLAARRYVNLARALVKVGDHAKAAEMARKALEKDPGSGAARAVLGRALAGQGRCAEALPELAAALRAEPADAEALEASKACGK